MLRGQGQLFARKVVLVCDALSDAVQNMLVDEFLPVYDVSDAVATVVDADIAKTWDALMDVDLIHSP